MDKKTVRKINQINQDFYNKVFEYFNTSRQFYWDGWYKLIPYLKKEKLKVLDVGCGNGRFGKFLMEKAKKIEYTGVDRSKELLKEAKKKVSQGKFYQFDLLSRWPRLDNNYDLIVMMAVIHHIPGRENRLKLLKKIKKLLGKNGLLVFTVWHFNKYKRFNKQVINWKTVGVTKSKVELNDYLLDWKRGVKALRYVHLFNNEEINWIVKNLKMKEVGRFVSDGQQGQGNQYVILKSVT